MSALEEEVELRDLLNQTLEKNGSLAKIKAQMRASIFLALDEDIKMMDQQPLQSVRVRSYLKTPEGRTLFYLVREFLDFFNFQFTIQVFEPESYLDSCTEFKDREILAKDLGLEDNLEVPLLQQILSLAQLKTKVLDTLANLDLNGSYEGSKSHLPANDNKYDVSINESSHCDVPSMLDFYIKENGVDETVVDSESKDSSVATSGNNTDFLKQLDVTFNVKSPIIKNLIEDEKTSVAEEFEDVEVPSEYSISLVPPGNSVSTNEYEEDFVSNNTSNTTASASNSRKPKGSTLEESLLGTCDSSLDSFKPQVSVNRSKT